MTIALRQRALRLPELGLLTAAANLQAAVHLADDVEDAAKVAVLAGAVANLHLDKTNSRKGAT